MLQKLYRFFSQNLSIEDLVHAFSTLFSLRYIKSIYTGILTVFIPQYYNTFHSLKCVFKKHELIHILVHRKKPLVKYFNVLNN